MSAGVVFVVFGLVAVAELPDKTMIATIVMGSRNPPVLVWLGAAGAFLVQAGIAVGAGRLIELLPHEPLEIVVTGLFFLGSMYLLFVPERRERARGEKEAGPAQRDGDGDGDGDNGVSPDAAGVVVPWKVVGTAFVVIVLGEFGDLTQLLMVNLVGRYHEPLSVFVGGSAGLLTASAAAAFGGRALLRWLPLEWIRRAGGIALLGFAAYGIYALAA